MSARNSPSFDTSHPSNLRSPQGRIPAAGSEGRQYGAHAKNGKFQPAPIVAAYQRNDQVPKRALTHKDVKNEGRSWDVLENKGEHDKIADHQTGFLAENALISRKWTTIDWAFRPKMHRLRDNSKRMGAFEACLSGCEGSAHADVAPTFRSAGWALAKNGDLRCCSG